MAVLCGLPFRRPRVSLYALSLSYLRVPLNASSLSYLWVALYAPSFGYPRVARTDGSRSHRRFLLSAKIALFGYRSFTWSSRFLAFGQVRLRRRRLGLAGLLNLRTFLSPRIVFYKLRLLL